MTTRVGVFGWGVVAPKSPNVTAFRENLEKAETWLSPFEGFGPNNFLVGQPTFRFEDYKPWIDARFAPRHFQNLKEKMGQPSLYAIGAFLQSLEQNPGLEPLLRELKDQVHIYLGTGLGAVEVFYKSSVAIYEAQNRWNAFWARPENNSVVAAYLQGNVSSVELPSTPPEQGTVEWNTFWMAHSPQLAEYLDEAAAIDDLVVSGEVESNKLNVLRERSKRQAKLKEKWGCPDPPWQISANFIWNIHNTPASQISILAGITGLVFAPVAACSTFGVALHLAMKAIQHGEAKIVVVGATDPAPHSLTVGSFYGARVISANRKVSNPLTHLQGTHVAGGSVIWIVGDMDYLTAKGFHPIGMEPVAVGVSADAHHIITPSTEGPTAAIQHALKEGNLTPSDIGSWDLHATATPGDYSEVMTLRSSLPEGVLVTARKGVFGHGMAAGGGWELMAQYMGYESGHIFPTPLDRSELNATIRKLHENFVFTEACALPSGCAGKLSMGIGGINACVISRPLKN